MRLFATSDFQVLLELKPIPFPVAPRLRMDELGWSARARLEHTPRVRFSGEKFVRFKKWATVLNDFKRSASKARRREQREREKERTQESRNTHCEKDSCRHPPATPPLHRSFAGLDPSTAAHEREFREQS